jgi:hypothetical protein
MGCNNLGAQVEHHFHTWREAFLACCIQPHSGGSHEPYVKLAKRLGGDVAAVHVMWVQFEEAEHRGRVRNAAMDGLARELTAHLKRGWGRGLHRQFNAAGADAGFLTLLDHAHRECRPLAEAVWRALQDLCPPTGWLPSGADDPLIVAAFAKGWPA